MSELALTGGPAVAAEFQARAEAWPLAPDAQAEAQVLDVLRSRRWGRLHADSYAERFENAFAAYQDARHGIAVANGTVSLQLILRTLNIGFGDEVIVPALTFIATASAVAEVGAVPIFADIEAETLTIDPESVAAAITPRTRAIIGVHYGGFPIDFDRLLPLASQHGLFLDRGRRSCSGECLARHPSRGPRDIRLLLVPGEQSARRAAKGASS